ncbi:MAG: hypothetical protein HGA78_07500 [Nitrospirales bacterium]|nr:hypothetical protein [Nitrospirales bacterium]
MNISLLMESAKTAAPAAAQQGTGKAGVSLSTEVSFEQIVTELIEGAIPTGGDVKAASHPVEQKEDVAARQESGEPVVASPSRPATGGTEEEIASTLLQQKASPMRRLHQQETAHPDKGQTICYGATENSLLSEIIITPEKTASAEEMQATGSEGIKTAPSGKRQPTRPLTPMTSGGTAHPPVPPEAVPLPPAQMPFEQITAELTEASASGAGVVTGAPSSAGEPRQNSSQKTSSQGSAKMTIPVDGIATGVSEKTTAEPHAPEQPSHQVRTASFHTTHTTAAFVTEDMASTAQTVPGAEEIVAQALGKTSDLSSADRPIPGTVTAVQDRDQADSPRPLQTPKRAAYAIAAATETPAPEIQATGREDSQQLPGQAATEAQATPPVGRIVVELLKAFTQPN